MQKKHAPLFAALLASITLPAMAQPRFEPEQLERIVQRIALYPDPLLAQVMSASTFSNQIPDAADYAGHHRYLHGEALSRAIQEDNLPWDPSVVSLIPFPSVLDMMASDMGWTQQLGNAVLSERGEVMEAVQRMRHRAYDYGYLRSNATTRVVPGPYIGIQPLDPGLLYVPRYDPMVVYARPRPGLFVGGAISFGAGIGLGASFSRWGWGGPAFGWGDHSIIIDNHPWERNWGNRDGYIHPYAQPYRRPDFRPGYRVEEYHGPAREEHDRREEFHEYRR